MRIALVSYEVAGARGGGIGTYVVEAGKALGAAGHEVWLVTAAERQRELLQRHPAFARVLFVEDATTPRHQVHFALGRRALWFAQLAHDVLLQAAVAFDYIEFADYGAAGFVAVHEQQLFGSHGKAVVAVALHSPTFECWQWNEALHYLGPSEREVAVLEDATVREASVVWSPSRRLGEMVAERLGLAADFAKVIRYPMALGPAPEPPPPRRRLEDLRFLFFGRIEPRKGVRQLVEAFRRLPGLQIECIGRDGNSGPGGGSEVAWLSRRGAANVTFTPPLPRPQLLQRLAAADVVVLPSPWDNWPNACLEAMAAARVVIGGRNGGMGEMIEPGRSGFLVDGADADALVHVIEHDLALALSRLPEIGSAAAQRVRELSEPKHYTAAIEALVAAHQPARVQLEAAPLVSVVMPFYREQAHIVGAAVDSALAQTHQQLEVVIVDDGSPRADAAAILDGLAARDRRVRVLHQQNGGLASARNFGISQARGELLLCLDADNLLRPDYAAIGVAVMAQRQDVMAIAPRLQIFDDRSGEPRTVIQPLPFDRPLAMLRNSLGDAGAMFRRQVFEVHGLRYDSMVDVYCDWALWLDMARLGLKVQLVPRVLYDYRLRAGSMMDEQAWDRHLALLGLLIERHLGADAAERAMLTTLAQGWGVGALLTALGGRPEAWEAPAAAAHRLRHDAMRYRLADAAGRWLERAPPLHRLAHRWLLGLSRLHGRWKDRRRGDRPV